MNVQHVSHQNSKYTPSFSGVKLDKALEVVKDNAVCKKMTKLDLISTQTYVKTLAFKMGITQEEIDALSKFEGTDFILESFEFLTKKLGLSKDIRPHLELIPTIPNNPFYMMYIPSHNHIWVDLSKLEGLDKKYKFAALRHEIQHFLQIADVYRHETFAPKIADIITEQFIAADKKSLEYVLTFSDEQILAAYQNNPEALQYIMNYKNIKMQNDDKLLADFWNQRETTYRQCVEALQQKIKNELGVIRADSPLTPKIERNMKEFENVGYLNPDCSINMAKYYDTEIEDEAILSQLKAQYEFEGVRCGVKKLKEETLNKLLAEEATEV